MGTTVTVQQMRDLDRVAIEEYGIPALVLMENAGAGAAREILQLGVTSALIVCGRGNNGGDGLVVARHLHNAGCEVSVVSTGEPHSQESALNDRIVQALAIPRFELASAQSWPQADCTVDALLGVGFSGPIKPELASAVRAIEARAGNSRIVAMDVPSGLDADSGVPGDPTVRAELTCYFGAIKRGLVTAAARDHVGRLVLVEISLPRSIRPA